MSKILDKAFDASKKIIRSIFLGSPNLLTSSDLNRQIEAIKSQLDQIEDRVGFTSDMGVSASLSSGVASVTYVYSYLECKGCSFKPTGGGTPLTINLTKSAPKAYLCLAADREIITYEDDFSHEIAGAKFSDGSSMAAANQMVYKNESIVLTHATGSVSNLVGVLAVIELTETNTIVIRRNYVAKIDSLPMDTLNRRRVILDYDNSLTGNIANNDPYDVAFSKLQNRLILLGTQLLQDVRVYTDGFTCKQGAHSKIIEVSFVTGSISPMIEDGDVVQMFVPFMINSQLITINEVLPTGVSGFVKNLPAIVANGESYDTTRIQITVSVGTSGIIISIFCPDFDIPIPSFNSQNLPTHPHVIVIRKNINA